MLLLFWDAYLEKTKKQKKKTHSPSACNQTPQRRRKDKDPERRKQLLLDLKKLEMFHQMRATFTLQPRGADADGAFEIVRYQLLQS